VPVVVAAGNDSRDARSFRPAAYDNVITVSALADFDGRPGGEGQQSAICPFYSSDGDDTFADFSNFGADVDIIAPGKCTLSTHLGGRYAWMSGTSMATPTCRAVVLYQVEHPEAGRCIKQAPRPPAG
jgi:subtilisin family serine protease